MKDPFAPKLPSATDEAEAAAEWAELVKNVSSRWTSRSYVIGPRQPKSLKDIRVFKPLPPRDLGIARMYSGLKEAVEFLNGHNSFRFIRGGMIANMCNFRDDIVAIINETVADDVKAGLLMEKIAYAFSRERTFGNAEGTYEPERRLSELSAKNRDGGIKRNRNNTAVAEALRVLKSVWKEYRPRYSSDTKLAEAMCRKECKHVDGSGKTFIPGVKVDYLREQFGRWARDEERDMWDAGIWDVSDEGVHERYTRDKYCVVLYEAKDRGGWRVMVGSSEQDLDLFFTSKTLDDAKDVSYAAIEWMRARTKANSKYGIAKWNKRDDIKPNAKRRSPITTSRG